MAAIEELPEELMTLILAKLPVKSLLRFKCVQKSWYSLINSPQFIRLHLMNRSSSSIDCFIVRSCIEQPRHVLSFHSYETLADLGNEINIPFSIWYDVYNDISFSGPCYGVVCITNHNDQIIICNPALREFRSLFVPPSFGNRSGYHIDSVAFGSDPKTGECKVVMIGVPFDNSHLYDPAIPDEECVNNSPYMDRYDDREAKVYDFSTDSWRETGVVIPAPFRYSCRAISLNGAFHWSPFDDSILTFHMCNELTESLPLPDFVDVSRSKDLFVSSESQLALIVYIGEKGQFEISVMTEYGVKESWTRLFLIGPFFDLYTPLAFWDEQQLLLQTMGMEGERHLVSCDLQCENIRHFPIYGDLSVNPFLKA